MASVPAGCIKAVELGRQSDGVNEGWGSPIAWRHWPNCGIDCSTLEGCSIVAGGRRPPVGRCDIVFAP
jgi:hypothetical protein